MMTRPRDTDCSGWESLMQMSCGLWEYKLEVLPTFTDLVPAVKIKNRRRNPKVGFGHYIPQAVTVSG